MKNGQSAALDLSNEQLQVLLTGKFGDGCLSTPKNKDSNSNYLTNCIYKEYLEYKKELLGDLAFNISKVEENGFAKKPIFQFSSHKDKRITILRNLDLESSIKLMDDLGLALWFYDDGSLHKDKLFYNLNTQAFSKEINEELFIPFLKNFDIKAKVLPEKKKDSRIFWYLTIGKYDGAYEISKILNKYYVNCYNYKIWSSETIQRWSKLQEKLKSTDKEISNRTKSAMLRKISL